MNLIREIADRDPHVCLSIDGTLYTCWSCTHSEHDDGPHDSSCLWARTAAAADADDLVAAATKVLADRIDRLIARLGRSDWIVCAEALRILDGKGDLDVRRRPVPRRRPEARPPSGNES